MLALIAEHPDGIRAGLVAESLGLDVDQARQYLSRLASTDRIVRVDRGLYAPRPPVASVAVSRSDTATRDLPRHSRHPLGGVTTWERTLAVARARAAEVLARRTPCEQCCAPGARLTVHGRLCPACAQRVAHPEGRPQ
ncbi:MAG: hypothetical protein M5U14_09390 [Acidimicrobiia bacterium]|nr:hypothetical protein [Acidimicrobiia bacterium]